MLDSRAFLSLLLLGALAGCGGDGGPPVGGDAGGDGDVSDSSVSDSSVSDGGGACGDRAITLPEECDDGNVIDGDGCSASCQIEVAASCGDGIVDRAAGELCDDGNNAPGDGCDARCQVEPPPSCGDGVLELGEGEECDDGNTLPGDGCSPSCQYEAVGAFCGDGVVDPLEVCDDGNTANGDGCSATCNFFGSMLSFVGQAGAAGSVDGIGSVARVQGWGDLVADHDYIWFAEGNPGAANKLRRIEIATAEIVSVATIRAVEGIATNGVDTVWVAGGDPAGLVIQSIGTSPPYTVTDLTSGAPCAAAGCYADGLPGTATFGGIRGLTWLGGYLWIVDPPAATIRRLDPVTGSVLTVAGSPFNQGSADGIGVAARFTSPRYIVSDNSGLLYISDTNGAAIRVLNTTTFEVTTFAGDGTAAYLDGIGTAARVHRPRGITSDGASVYWTEFNAHTIRQGILATQEVSTLIGVPMTPGDMEGTGSGALVNNPFSITFHFPSNSLFFLDGGNNVIRRIQ